MRYVPATLEGPTATVDQYLVPSVWRPNAHIGLTTDSVWQSFRADLDGDFHRMDLYTHSTVSQPVRLRVYAGTGPLGMPLLDMTATMDADTSWTSFFFTPGIASEAGNSYTALATTSSSFAILLPSGATYANGESGLNGPDIEGPDVEFRQWVIATPDCQETTRYYTLYEVPARPVSNLPVAYCHADERMVQLTVDPLLITSSAIQLDGEALSTFTPASLAMGEHLARHIYTINGCTDTLDQVFVVEPPPTFSFPNLTPPICTTDEPFVIDADPYGGYFRINGVRDSLLVTADLGVGTHTIDYLYSTLLDTVDFMDQVCCYEGFPAYHQLLPDSIMWQSFIAQQSGDLVVLRTGILLLSNDPRTFQVSFLAGTGLGGQVLWSDTRTTTDGYNALFANTGLVVEQGSTYTFAFHYLPDDVPLPLPEVLHYTGNGYANGEGYVPGIQAPADLYFNEVVRQRFPCADSTSFSVSVEGCSGIADNLFPGMYVAPVPFNDRLVLNTGADAVRFAMHAADGRLMFSSSALPNAQHQLPVSGLPAGCYALRIWGRTGERSDVLKLVKE